PTHKTNLRGIPLLLNSFNIGIARSSILNLGIPFCIAILKQSLFGFISKAEYEQYILGVCALNLCVIRLHSSGALCTVIICLFFNFFKLASLKQMLTIKWEVDMCVLMISGSTDESVLMIP